MKKNSVKLAAVCYNKQNRQESNLLVITELGVECVTLQAGRTDIHYLNEYPIHIYELDKVELPLFHSEEEKMVFYRLECIFDDSNNSTCFKILEEAENSLFENE